MYSLTVSNEHCTSSDTINITLDPCEPANLTIPNIITPNGDGYNDKFLIPENHIFEYSLRIYNRWGTLVFEEEDYENTWKAEGLKDGSYFYKIAYEGQEWKGWVEVVR